jgi:hypothetical protein
MNPEVHHVCHTLVTAATASTKLAVDLMCPCLSHCPAAPTILQMCDASKWECPSRMAFQSQLNTAFRYECDCSFKPPKVTVLFECPFRKGNCEDGSISHVVLVTTDKKRCQKNGKAAAAVCAY